MVDIILDTNAIKQMYKRNVAEHILSKIRENCDNLIFPEGIRSEVSARVKVPQFNILIMEFMTSLRNKFISKRCHDRHLKEEFRKKGLKKKDREIACVAVERAKKVGNVLLITDDPDFREYHVHENLSEHKVKVMGFNDFLNIL